MTARTRLLTGPQPATLTNHLLGAARAVAGSAWWIAPTPAHVARVGPLPEGVRGFTMFQAAAALAKMRPDQTLLTDARRRQTLRFVFDSIRGARKFTALSVAGRKGGLSSAVHDFVEELHELGVTPEQFLEYARQSSSGPARDRLDEELAALDTAYRSLCAKLHLVDTPGLFELATQRPAPTLAAVFVDGFAQFTPAQIRLLQHLAGQASEFWISLATPGEESPAAPEQTLASLYHAFPSLEVVESNEPPDSGPSAWAARLFIDASPAGPCPFLSLIEAPGTVGECRLVARTVRERIDRGAAPSSILVSARSLATYDSLLAETFDDYAIPTSQVRHLTFDRVPVVIALLQAAQLPDHGWPIGEVAAVLRASWFLGFAGSDAYPELPLLADWLLHDLGIPRDRDAYLRAVVQWAESPPTPLEDESEASVMRRRRNEFAIRSKPLLERFFAAWDAAPSRATLAEHIAWLKSWAAELRFPAEGDLAAWWDSVDRWEAFDATLAPQRAVSRAEFLRLIEWHAAEDSIARGDPETDGVRILAADAAAGLTCDHLFVLGLGEGGFPRLSAGPRLYSETDRAEFRAVGLDLDVAADRLGNEMLLFHRLLSTAKESITLARPAVDAKGQEQLPGAFWREVTRLAPDANMTRQAMLIERFDEAAPRSAAERRIRFATSGNKGESELKDHLDRVRAMTLARFRDPTFNRFDGLLQDDTNRAEIAESFGAKKRYSATSLEDYVACPFKYLAKHVLRLAPLLESGDEVQAHSRGSALHRALARLGPDNAPGPRVAQQLSGRLAATVREELDRASGPIQRKLWELERDRIERSVRRYPEQWQSHEKWAEPIGKPRHHLAEHRYALDVIAGDATATLHGIIDRIDLVEGPGGQGSLVIDYKTGRGTHYKSSQVVGMEKLQLGVYGLAIERELPDYPPRGLMYWLPLEKGPHGRVPRYAKNWSGSDGWPAYRERLITWLTEIVERIRRAEFVLRPRSDDSCQYCEYARVCRVASVRARIKDWDFELPVAPEADDE